MKQRAYTYWMDFIEGGQHRPQRLVYNEVNGQQPHDGLQRAGGRAIRAMPRTINTGRLHRNEEGY